MRPWISRLNVVKTLALPLLLFAAAVALAPGVGAQGGSTIFVGTDYTDSGRHFTITLKSGWREDFSSKKNELMYLTNGNSIALINGRSGRDAESLFNTCQERVRSIFVDFRPMGQKVVRTIDNAPVILQWFRGTDEKGAVLRTLVGIWVLPGSSVEFVGLVKESNEQDYRDMGEMFISIRTPAAGGGGSTATTGGQTGGGSDPLSALGTSTPATSTPTTSANRYTDPTSYATVDLQPGWRADSPDLDKKEIMNLTNGESSIWVYKQADSTSASEIYDRFYQTFSESFGLSIDGPGVTMNTAAASSRGQWFTAKNNKNGRRSRLLLAAMTFGSGGGVAVVGFCVENNTADRNPINAMFSSIRSTSSGYGAGPAPATGGQLDSNVGGAYSDPGGNATIVVQPGWKTVAIGDTDVKNGWIMRFSKGAASFWVQRRADGSEELLSTLGVADNMLRSSYQLTKSPDPRRDNIGGYPYVSHFCSLKDKNGNEYTALTGAATTSRGRLLVYMIIPKDNLAKDLSREGQAMFLSLR